MTTAPAKEMFEKFDETQDDVVAIRVRRGTKRGYEELYLLLVEKIAQYGAVTVYEEVLDWTTVTFLSHLHGVIPDLRYGFDFTIHRYGAAGTLGGRNPSMTDSGSLDRSGRSLPIRCDI